MAKDKKPAEVNSIETINENLTKASRRVEENKKVFTWIACIIVAAGAVFCAWLFFFHQPRIQKTMEAYSQATLEQNDTVATRNLQKLADEGTWKGANLAALDAAQKLYDMGKYQDAIKYLDKFKTKETVIGSLATVLKGDCYANLKKYNEAVGCFDKAVKESDGNPEVVPYALMKMATVFEAQKKYKDALACYEQIKKDYPTFSFNNLSMDAYISRATETLAK